MLIRRAVSDQRENERPLFDNEVESILMARRSKGAMDSPKCRRIFSSSGRGTGFPEAPDSLNVNHEPHWTTRRPSNAQRKWVQ
jgi:hypothetical protein